MNAVAELQGRLSPQERAIRRELLQRDIDAKHRELAELMNARAREEAACGVYRCTVCRLSYVSPEDGQDTCDGCLGRV